MTSKLPISLTPDDLKRFFELSSDLLAIAGEDGYFKLINPAFEQVLGISEAELLAQPFITFIHPEDRAASQTEMTRLTASDRTVQFCNRFRTRAGDWKWLEWNVNPFRESADRPLLFYCTARDVTERYRLDAERKAAQVALHQLNVELEARVVQRTTEIQRYAEAIENMQAGFYLWQLEDANDARSFHLLLANPAAEQLTTITNTAVLQKSMSEGFPQLFETDLPETYRDIVLSGHQQDLGDIDYVIASGERRVFAVKAFPLAHQCLGILFDDVTDQRRTRQQLSDQKEQLKILFDQAGVGIARLALDGRWVQVNDKFCEMLGYARAELLQTNFQTITHPDDAENDQRHYQALMSGQVDNTSLEKRYLHKNGEALWCSVTVSVIRDESRQPLYFIAFIEDITERKIGALTLLQQKKELAVTNLTLAQTMAKLEHRNQELDQFAYVASHDLKAPLRAIANLSTWIEEDIGDRLPPENKQQLELLQGRVHRMESLIDGLLAYSRAGRSKPIAETVNLNQLLRETVDSLAPPATFTVEIAPDLPIFLANRVPLIQVFNNLVSNAIKHHHRTDGRVEIRYRQDSDRFYEFSVTDDGPGIDPAYHARIFNIFQVLEARDKVENTGIGLAIVKKMVESEGGKISVDSQVGQGTTFRFTWPITPEP